MKKTFLFFVALVSPMVVLAQTYKPLSSNSPFFTDTNMKIGDFVQQLFTWSIGIASVLTVFMLILGGFKYLTSAASSADETKKAKEQIRNALLGLFLLIISVFILQTINPSLTRLDAVLPEVSIDVVYAPVSVEDYLDDNNIDGNERNLILGTHAAYSSFRAVNLGPGEACFEALDNNGWVNTSHHHCKMEGVSVESGQACCAFDERFASVDTSGWYFSYDAEVDGQYYVGDRGPEDSQAECEDHIAFLLNNNDGVNIIDGCHQRD